MSGLNDGINPYKRRKSERKFVVRIHKGEMEQITQWVMKKDNIETGGDLFGLWIDQHTAVVQFVLGPGERCRRTTTSFFQDVKYLDKAGQHLIKHHGLCNIGQWHSHHRINLPRPSGGDEKTVWGNMPQLGMSRYIVFIANIKSSGQAVVNCFLFEIENARELPVLPGEFKILENINSPFRLNESILSAVFDGAESFNEISADKNEKPNVGKEIKPSPNTETDNTKIKGSSSPKDHGNKSRRHGGKTSEEKRDKTHGNANAATNQGTGIHSIHQSKENSGQKGSDQGTNKAGGDRKHQFTSENFWISTRDTVKETTAEDVSLRATQISSANDAVTKKKVRSEEIPVIDDTESRYRATQESLDNASKGYGYADTSHGENASSKEGKPEKRKSEEKRDKVDRNAITAPNQVTEIGFMNQSKDNSGQRGSDEGTNKAGGDRKHNFPPESSSILRYVTVKRTTAENVSSKATFTPANDTETSKKNRSKEVTQKPSNNLQKPQVTYIGGEDGSSHGKTNVFTTDRESLERYYDPNSGNYGFPIKAADRSWEPQIPPGMVSRGMNNRNKNLQPLREEPHGHRNPEIKIRPASEYDNQPKGNNSSATKKADATQCEVFLPNATSETITSQHEVSRPNTPSEAIISQPQSTSNPGKAEKGNKSQGTSWLHLLCCPSS